MKRTIILAALIAAAPLAGAQLLPSTIGVSAQPGIHARWAAGPVAGVYRDENAQTAAYAGWSFGDGGPLSVAIGIQSATYYHDNAYEVYRCQSLTAWAGPPVPHATPACPAHVAGLRRAVRPFIAPSVAFDLTQRLSVRGTGQFAPDHGPAWFLMLEYRL